MNDLPDLTQALKHVYWLGGASGAGKSTIARRLAQTHDMLVYATDDSMGDHASRCRPEDCPRLEEFKQMTMDQRWVERSPEVMLDTFHWFNGEAFELILEDLVALPKNKKVIVEGFRLLPHLVKPILANPHQALWLIPSADFRLAAFTSRGTLWDIANKTTQPEIALHNLLTRDHMFAERLATETANLGLTTLLVDEYKSADDLANAVASHFRI